MPPFTPLRLVEISRSEIIWEKHDFKQVKMSPFTPLRLVEIGRSEIIWEKQDLKQVKMPPFHTPETGGNRSK